LPSVRDMGSAFKYGIVCSALAAVLLLSGAVSMTAPVEKPVISIFRNSKVVKSIEAEASIEASLKAYPKIYDDLLAEARREVDEWLAKNDKWLSEEKENSLNGVMLSIGLDYRLAAVTGNYVSILRAYGECGGQCSSYDDAIISDKRTGKRFDISHFFRETASGGATLTVLAKLARIEVYITLEDIDRSVASQRELEELSADLHDNIKPDLRDIGAITLAPSLSSGKSSGLMFHYSSGFRSDNEKNAFKPVSIFVSWTKFKSLLSPDGARLFGGERPPSNEDNK